jgi:hypothetical protein
MGKHPSAMTGINLIRAHRGMAAGLAAHLGVSRAAVSRWIMIPAEQVGSVADYTGYPRCRLRPDLWPPCGQPPKAKRKAKAKQNGHAK